jgi:hypothetical protein
MCFLSRNADFEVQRSTSVPQHNIAINLKVHGACQAHLTENQRIFVECLHQIRLMLSMDTQDNDGALVV